MSEPRRPFPQFNAFRSFVSDELDRRKTTYPTPIAAPFARFTSCMSEPDPKFSYVFFTLGLHGFDAEDMNIFDSTYTGRDIVGYAVDVKGQNTNGEFKNRLVSADELSKGAAPPVLQQRFSKTQNDIIASRRGDLANEIAKLPALGSHPVPGVESVTVRREGLGAPLIVDVEWTCYNRSQLEFLRNHFMICGRYVVVEWGNQFHDKKLKTLNFKKVDETKKILVDSILHGRRTVIEKTDGKPNTGWVAQNNGNYDFVVGMVGNFKVSLDDSTGIYRCTTTLYTMGENMYGINLFNTIIKRSDDVEVSATKNFNDFFKYGGKFDQLVENNRQDYKSVSIGTIEWLKNRQNDASTSRDFKNVSLADNDYAFVSWEFFTKTVMREMFATMTDPNLKADALKVINFFNGENQFSSSSLTPSDEQNWVGFHKYLRSTDIDTMVLISSTTKTAPGSMASGGGIDEFPESQGFRGKLEKGVWLNTDVIRTAFLSNRTLQEAMIFILNKMNNAVGGYWDLRLFYDDELNVFKVIDFKHTNKPTKLERGGYYRFNELVEGECFNIDMDSAFPPELITQMALYAHFKSSIEPRQIELLEKYPTLGTTSLFMFSLNWTALEDVVEKELGQRMQQGQKLGSQTSQLLTSLPDKTEKTAKLSSRVTGLANNVVTPAVSVTMTGGGVGVNAGSLIPKINTDAKIDIPKIVEGGHPSGQRSWRNNNPGNIEYTEEARVRYNAVREDIPVNATPEMIKKYKYGRFAKYPSSEVGFQALVDLIDSKYKSGNYTFESFLLTYAPAFENPNIQQRIDRIV
jgi:hypothetical protein